MSTAGRSQKVLLGTIAFVAAGFALWATRPVMVMVVLAAFLAILLQPAVGFLQRFVPKWLALVVIMLGLGALLVALGGALVVQARSVVEKTPEYAARFHTMLQGGIDLAKDVGLELTWREVGTTDAVGSAIGYVTEGVQGLFALAVQTLLLLIMVVFMLVEAPVYRDKLGRAFGEERSRRVVDSLDSATDKIQRYVVTKTVVSLVTGVITALVTDLLGLDFPFVWGAIAFQLNFIPYIGSIIAVIPPTLIALVQFDTPTIGLVTLLLLGSIQFSIGNIIEPRIMGRSLQLSPLVVFISMFFWGWFWGMAGVFLSVPLTALVQVVCEHVDSLRPIAVLIGDPRAIEADPPEVDAAPG